MAEQAYDFVIVGGGAAGCVLANRLSADPGTRVLLLEAGRPDYWWDLAVHLPLAMGMPVGSAQHDWRYVGEPEPLLQSRRLEHPRGKVLGGSTSINGMLYTRGHRADFDRWATETGTSEWDYAHCLPYFRRLERSLGEVEDAFRGRSGPHTVARNPVDGPIFDAFFGAVREAGYAVLPDLNGSEQEGFGPLDQGVRRGRRESAARAYLHPVRRRPNLEVRSRVQVTRVEVEGGRAVGVRFRHGRGEESVVRVAEVVLSAGAVGSPQILQLSGIGRAAALEALGIPVVQDLPGVGESLQDHLAVHVQHTCTEPVSMASVRRKSRWPKIVAEALVLGRGPGAWNPMRVGGFVRSSPEQTYPDLSFVLAPLAMASEERSMPVDQHGYQMHIEVMRSSARGSVAIRSTDPAVHPALRLNFLAGDEDRQRWLNAVRLGRELLARPAMRRLDGGEWLPGAAVATDEQVMEWVSRTGQPGMHLCSSTRMGVDEDAVLDPATMRVRGLEGLRVVDAGAFPSITNANTYAPTLMLAEKAADIVLGNTPAAPENPAARTAGVDADDA
ncbi:choline dehydrogenase [Pseudonocardia kunmingensis]|uniref:Choline dehydrogenase n=1 Tax=Pseudonocardia kunmingensis TaxID=630975 RepID=A0A543CYE8_9PSEU|nr:choline dehydrogenase [Pseudonocardia kunmingensis]TQM02105.1 choline dehydrogenase [Pseudonocardia kunmingensis]